MSLQDDGAPFQKKAKWSKLLVHGELIRFSATLECDLASMTSQMLLNGPRPGIFSLIVVQDFCTHEPPDS
jgi:hypothetical protein